MSRSDLLCPSCGAAVPLSQIPNEALKSERGRRNAAKRKSFHHPYKGQVAVWARHNSSARQCRCSKCLVVSVRKFGREVEARIRAHVQALGVEPEWASQERQRVECRRSELESAMRRRFGGLNGVRPRVTIARQGDSEAGVKVVPPSAIAP